MHTLSSSFLLRSCLPNNDDSPSFCALLLPVDVADLAGPAAGALLPLLLPLFLLMLSLLLVLLFVTAGGLAAFASPAGAGGL